MEVLPRLALLLPQSAARKTELKKVTARLQKKMAVFGDELKKLPASERAGCTKQGWMMEAFIQSKRKRGK